MDMYDRDHYENERNYEELESRALSYFAENASEIITDRLKEELSAEVFAANTFAEKESIRLLAAADDAYSGSCYAAALFHAHRAVDGFEIVVLRNPMWDVLSDALGQYAGKLGKLPTSQVFTQHFLAIMAQHTADLVGASKDVSQKLRGFHQEHAALRNRVFHGFHEPSADDARSCIDAARACVTFAIANVAAARRRTS